METAENIQNVRSRFFVWFLVLDVGRLRVKLWWSFDNFRYLTPWLSYYPPFDDFPHGWVTIPWKHVLEITSKSNNSKWREIQIHRSNSTFTFSEKPKTLQETQHSQNQKNSTHESPQKTATTFRISLRKKGKLEIKI